MGLAIFENYSHTKEGTNYAPFIVHTSQVSCFDLVVKWVKENAFEAVEVNRDYFEVFGKKDNFEVTIEVTSEEQGALVNISVFGQKGKTRKKLKEIISMLISYFG